MLYHGYSMMMALQLWTLTPYIYFPSHQAALEFILKSGIFKTMNHLPIWDKHLSQMVIKNLS